MLRTLSNFILTCAFVVQTAAYAQPTPAPQTLQEKTAAMQKYPGYFDFYWDHKAGKIWIEIDKLDSEFLYVNSLAAGIGSNDIGLDRSQLGQSRVVKFYRSGSKVLLIEPNYRFRANSGNTAERRAVEEAFAQSVLWGFEIATEEPNRLLVDATDFLLRDAHDVPGRLKQAGQGVYRLESSRCAIYLPRTKNFPQNSEFEAILTFTGDSPGQWLREVVPTPEAITVREHHSFIQLPDAGYTPRRFDPRAGFYPLSYLDFATPIDQPVRKSFITRHRLRKKHPQATLSEAVEPIVYYVDSGAPEPIRSALVEGASWWNQAFEAAGYKNAFQVKILPADADPMDVRYNVIQWVHRSTRGWSYGSSVDDPRTGEIIKGHVLLGSLRVRQDFLIAQGLLSPYEHGKPVSDRMQQMALARLRQLAAHEVGHTLGLSHNFAASTHDRASVMDYPHPLAKLRPDDTVDLSEAYATGIGAWDKVAIAYGYQDFPAGTDEQAALDGVINKSLADGLIFISDADARPAGGAHPLAHLWDNGKSAIDELENVLRVRRAALHHFSLAAIPEGAPVTTLEEVLVPLYLFHRYQAEAVAKLLGGNRYTYAVRGDGQEITRIVAPAEQSRALKVLLRCLSPQELALPENILELLPPRAFGYFRGRELFGSRTGVTFDPLSAAEAAADPIIALILHPQRAGRLIVQHARNSASPSLDSAIDELIAATWQAPRVGGLEAEIQFLTENLVLRHLLQLAVNEQAHNQARAIARAKIEQLDSWLARTLAKADDESQKAHLANARAQIALFRQSPEKLQISPPMNPPDGAPIGSEPFGCGWQRE